MTGEGSRERGRVREEGRERVREIQSERTSKILFFVFLKQSH